MSIDDVILINSDDAAEFRTDINGWVSRTGRYFGADEHTARYDGCTHTFCNRCGNPVTKMLAICEECYKKHLDERYERMPKQEWNEKSPVNIYGTDEYFFTMEDINLYCEEHNINKRDLKFVLCKPVYADLISLEHYEDYLSEGDTIESVSPELVKKIEELNQWIDKSKIILSWKTEDIAAIIE